MTEEFEAGLGMLQDDHDRLMDHMNRRRQLMQQQSESQSTMHRINPELDDCGNPLDPPTVTPHIVPDLTNDALDLITARIKQLQEQNDTA